MKTIDLYCPHCRAKLHDSGGTLRGDGRMFMGECGACHESFKAEVEVTIRYETSPFPLPHLTPPPRFCIYPVLQRGDA